MFHGVPHLCVRPGIMFDSQDGVSVALTALWVRVPWVGEGTASSELWNFLMVSSQQEEETGGGLRNKRKDPRVGKGAWWQQKEERNWGL